MNALHLGIPTDKKIEGKNYNYVESLKLYVTNPDEHAYKLQFVWAEPDSPLPEIVRTEQHLAIKVNNIDQAIEEFDQVVFPPHVVNDKLKICFAVKENVLFELTEVSG